MLKPVRCPILVTTHAHKALVAQHAGPHDIRTRVIVFGLGQHTRRLGADGAHERQVHAIGHRYRPHVIEKALQQVAIHISDARSRLERRQRKRKFRVHKRQLGALVVVGVAGFHAQFVVADNGVFRRLAAGCRNGKHHGNGQHVGVRVLFRDELPHVVIDARAVGDGLRRVHHRAAAHSQHPVHVMLFAQRHALAHQADLGVRAHAAKLHVRNTGIVQRRAHAIDEPRLHGALPAEVQQHLARAALGQHGANLRLGVVAEHEMRRGNELEVFHGNRLPRLREKQPPASPASNVAASIPRNHLPAEGETLHRHIRKAFQLAAILTVLRQNGKILERYAGRRDTCVEHCNIRVLRSSR